MAEVYFYIPANDADNAIECGLKLSTWFGLEVLINNEEKKCISALINPKDDIEKFKSAEYKCLKLELPPKYCFIADKYLFKLGLNSVRAMELYIKSIIPIENYIFGLYRLPECLITSTVISEQISLINKNLDSPVLFNNSEELYINNIIETYKDEHPDFNDCLLYSFYSMLAENGKADKIVDIDNKISIFIDKKIDRAYTIKMPDITEY
jgi:hypothetical protein